MKKFVLSAALLFSALAGNAEGISSPSGMVKLDFELTKDGRPAYQVDYKGAPVINPSTLGLELKGATSLMDGFKVVRTSTSTFDETWQPVWGETKDIRNHYNESGLFCDKGRAFPVCHDRRPYCLVDSGRL